MAGARTGETYLLQDNIDKTIQINFTSATATQLLHHRLSKRHCLFAEKSL